MELAKSCVSGDSVVSWALCTVSCLLVGLFFGGVWL